MRPFAGLAGEASHAVKRSRTLPQSLSARELQHWQRVWQGLGYRAAGRARGSVSERLGNIGRGPVLSTFLSGRACATTRTCARIGIRAGNRGDGIMAGRGLAAECVRCSREHIGKTDVRKAGRYRNFTYNANRGCTNPASGLHDRWEIRKFFPFMRARNIGAHSFRQRLKKCLAPIYALSVYRCIHQRKQSGWTGMSPDCFRGKCMHQIVGAFQTVHNPLRASCSPFFPGATAVYFPRTPVCSQEYGKGCTSSLFQVVLQLSGAKS